MDPTNYIQIGDEVSIMWTSITLTGFSGKVIDIGPGEYGHREFVIQKEGTEFGKDPAVGVPESKAVFSVRRGDCMVGVPLPLLMDEAVEKERRRVINERKRIEKKAPLFADQIAIAEGTPDNWVTNSFEAGAEKLERDHRDAMAVNVLRDEAESLCSPDDFAYLCGRRKAYPLSAIYGLYFWRNQLGHIKVHGAIERVVIPQPLAKKLNLPWLKYGEHLTWKSDEGPRRVMVLFVGSETVMIQLLPNDLRKENLWIKPEDFAEYEAAS